MILQRILPRRVFAEALATAGLVMAVVGSGIMGDRLSMGNTAVALLANSVATGAALIVLIVVFGPVSGAHMNPVVTAMEGMRERWPIATMGLYILAQLAGGVAGAMVAHGMFGLPLATPSEHVRTGGAQLLGEGIATMGLLVAIRGASVGRPAAVPFVVSAYITGAYWFTSSTSFANPAVTLARSLTDTFSGIRPMDVPAFVGAQCLGGLLGAILSRFLFVPSSAAAEAA